GGFPRRTDRRRSEDRRLPLPSDEAAPSVRAVRAHRRAGARDDALEACPDAGPHERQTRRGVRDDGRFAMKTYGTLTYKNGAWHVDAEPHVVLRLKRVFPRVSSTHRGTIRLTDTVEVCRDLEWFMERYPLEFADDATRERLLSESQRHKERETLVADLLAGLRPP